MRRIITLLLLTAVPQPSFAAVDIQRLIGETQKSYQGPTDAIIAWWLPLEFWEQTAQDAPGGTRAENTMEELLGSYTIIAIAAARLDPSGELTVRTREELLENTQLHVNGQSVAPLSADRIAEDAAQLLNATKPIAAHLLGRAAQGVEFLVYPNEGRTKIRGTDTGSISCAAFGVLFQWKLPLASLLPPMLDTNTGETFPGDFRFNPYTGNSLIPEP